MRALLQRVSHAEVRTADGVVGRIDRGLLVVLGVGPDDDERAAVALVVSQFTLFADARKGNRPSFVGAAPPERADALYARYVAALRDAGVPVATGTFQAHMEVELINDGPVTIWLDGDELGGRR